MSFLHNLIASLPDNVPMDPEELEIQAADEEKKSDDKPKDDKKPKDEKAPADDKSEGLGDKPPVMEGLPNLAPPMIPGMPGSKPMPGAKVRDKLSGQEGVVVPAPPGNFGEVVFVKSDADGLTHPVLSEFLETLPDMMPPMAPDLGAPEGGSTPAPDSPIPTTPELGGGPSVLAPKASKTTGPGYRAHLQAKKKLKVKALNSADVVGYAKDGALYCPACAENKGFLDEAQSGNPEINPVFADDAQEGDTCDTCGEYLMGAEPTIRAKKSIQASLDFIVTAAADERKLKYSGFLKQVKAIAEPTHAAVLDVLGYVPENWDLLVARLMQDGVILRSKMGKYDVMEFVAKGFSTDEIRLMLGRNGVPMYALDAAFKKIKADTYPAGPKKGEPIPQAPEQEGPETDVVKLDALKERMRKSLGPSSTPSPKKVKADRSVGYNGYTIEETAEGNFVIRDPKGFTVEGPPLVNIDTAKKYVDLDIRDNRPKVKADKPTKPMPTTPAGQGMTWAWDTTAQDWYETPTTV